MAGHHCNVVFGNYHGLFSESCRAQIHSVRSMSSLISAYPILDADFSFFYFFSIRTLPLPSFDLHSTRPQNVRKAAEDENEERIRQDEEDEEDKKHTEVGRVISVVSHA